VEAGPGDDAVLAHEARILARYLVGREPLAAHVERYVAGCRALFREAPAPEDAAVLGWVRRHPWSVGPLDAASGLWRPGATLRNRLLLMAAVLETTPEFADAFLPRQVGPLALMLRVGAAGLVAVASAAAGVVLFGLIARRAR
jgi:hypothetical protein